MIKIKVVQWEGGYFLDEHHKPTGRYKMVNGYMFIEIRITYKLPLIFWRDHWKSYTEWVSEDDIRFYDIEYFECTHKDRGGMNDRTEG